jgi:putative transposase
METITSSHAVTKIGYHIIWCTKFRHQILKNAVEIELKCILAETCITQKWKLRSVEVMPDHVHLFVQTDHTIAPVQISQLLKSTSAIHIFHKFPNLKAKKFWGSGLWSSGCFYSTVGHISEDTVLKYIATQKCK